MRILLATLAAAALSACALYDASPEEKSEFRALTATAIGIPEDGIRIYNTHGLLLNMNWSARTPRGDYYCSRDLNGDITCRPD